MMKDLDEAAEQLNSRMKRHVRGDGVSSPNPGGRFGKEPIMQEIGLD